MTPEKLVVDTDPALLTFGLDVDDDLALLFILASPEVELVGVTTTFGNTLGMLAYRDALRLLELADRSDIPVERGAGFSNRGHETAASRFLLEITSKYPGEIALLTLGPLTNVATAASADPGFARRLKRLVVMGGRAESGGCEFNFRRDPAAADAVLALPVKKTQIAFDLAFPIVITPGDVDRLASNADSLLARFAPKLRRFARFQDRFRALRGRSPGQAAGGFHPWDVVAAAYLIAPELFEERREISIHVDARGCSLPETSGTGVVVPTVANADALKALILERLPKIRAAEKKPREG